MKKEIILASTLLMGLSLVLVPPVQAKNHSHAKKYSIADREASLEKKITDGYNANQLTLQQSDDMKSKLKKIQDTEQKMKDKNGGKLSYENNTSLEKSLNKVSEKLQKDMLEKRVQ